MILCSTPGTTFDGIDNDHRRSMDTTYHFVAARENHSLETIMPHTTTELHLRFLRHLIDDLQQLLAPEHFLMSRELHPLNAVMSEPELDLATAKSLLQQITARFAEPQYQGRPLEEEEQATIQAALKSLTDACASVSGDQLDAFVAAVLGCRDRILALSFMFQTRRQYMRA